jgi:hypothetical protein
MRATVRRVSGGQALRDAIRNYGGGAGITLQALASRTRALDPAGKGVSYQLIGFLVQSGKGRQRDTTSPETATLLANALAVPVGTLFTVEEAPDPADKQPAWADL